MKKEEDVFQIYNEMDKLLDSINLDNKKEKSTDNNNINDIPDMPKVFFDEEKKPIEYKEKTEEEKEQPKEKK
ncbi:MAG: hypothetical protein IKL65_00710 [Bacilli bacterium]|nr:hypothetical protein [Bacilli bacterium]